MDLHIPIWIIRVIVAVIAFIAVVVFVSKYKDKPKGQVPVFIIVCGLMFAGLYWIVSLVG